MLNAIVAVHRFEGEADFEGGGSEKTSADKQLGDLSVLFAFDGSAKGDGWLSCD